ncbi:hypothetical protein [Photobacterium chitinilyticum]|uniref:Uncharacterized protein n=1 Tax=Photobacterium chitinilyticum TaxID=2485123 RepID=A0A444JLI7_9GAMM|nr:hypothetical protein [Photobacterium chitinilyticum]RWX53798.1 hypothetical protein EDI28_20310 [Photobacterium chitinilyticum]
MLRIKDVFSPELALQKLYETFQHVPEVLSAIMLLTAKEAQFLAVLVDGKTISNGDYDVGADFVAPRVDGTVGELRRKHYFPIWDESIRVTSDSGRSTRVKRYYIHEEQLQHLLTDPAAVFNKIKRSSWARRTTRETHDIDNLLKRRGIDGALKRILHQHYQHKAISPKQWKVIEDDFLHHCTTLDAANDEDGGE